ncbi:MAG TPA: hypothetical protein VLF94_02575 [Chlamydiales bacterium]|nr:hypothetical protein [Chlamydiales bacterium]
MAQSSKPATILDMTRGLGYGFVYQPTIGVKSKSQYPLAIRFPSSYRQFRRRQKSK